MNRGHKTELRPNNRQRTLLLKNAGAARWTYNWGLDQKKAALDAKVKIPNAIELHRRLNCLKKTELSWMYEVSKCGPQEALRNLDKAFDRYWSARRTGRKVGFPKFKSKKSGAKRFRLTGVIKVASDRIQLPRLGTIRLKERGYLPVGAKVLNATVSEKAGRWFVSVIVESSRPIPSVPKDERAIVGVDLGIKTLATVSDGAVYQNPRPLSRHLRRLQRLDRSASRKVKGSKNWRKAVSRVARLHVRIANIRRDILHKITTKLTKTKLAIGIEDLNVAKMLKNRLLSRAISELGLSEFRRRLVYKASWYDCRVVLADRFFPSSKTCHRCGEINRLLKLSNRVWTCGRCGTCHDRDMNAALNLERVAASSAETINACEAKSSSPRRASERGTSWLQQE